MAVTESNYTVSNSSTTNYSFTFPYLKTTDVKVSINGTVSTAWGFANATTIQLNSNPTVGDKIRIYRETDDSKLEATFFAGSAIKSSDLNDNFNQNLYVTQESNNKIDAAWTTGDETIISTETWDSLDTRVATTKAIDGRVDAKIDTALTTDVVGGQSITITDNSPGSGQITASVTAGSIRGTELAGDAVDGTKIADDSINSEHYVDGSIDTQHIANAQVTHDKLANDCIDGDNIQNDVINSEHYVAGSIDTEHIADSQVTTVKIADLNVTTAKIAADAITGAKIADDQIDSEHLVADSIDTEHYAPNSVDTNALGADAVTGAQVADNAIDSEHYVDGSVDHVHLANDCIDGDNIQDDVVNSEHIAAGALDTEHYATGSITSDKLNSATVITNSEQSGASANDTSFFTSSASDARYFNVSTGDTIKDGDTFPDNDTTIATTAAINDRIIDLVDDVGGFVPIANETSFPNANPDVNNGAGTLVSIKALSSNLTSNGSGVATIANGTVGNSTVTITGLANSTTYASTFGMIVETTSTLNTYTFHRLVPKATEVTTVSGSIANVNTVANSIANVNTVASDLNEGTSEIDTVATNITNVNNVGGSIANVNTVATNINNVNDFSDKYRVASSAPTSGLDAGDLYFDTTGNELKVYNGSAWQGGVTATGNLLSKSGDQMTGNLTFSGSQTVDGRDVSVDGTKLDGIETGATADQTNAEIRSAVEAASDSNVFTDADHTKLNAIEANATADQTDAEIRAAVEAASDSHVFTDADHTKLNAIEAGATADQTKSDIDALNINADTVDGIHGASFLRSDANDTATGQLSLTSSSQYPLNINSAHSGKIVLQGANDPYITFREGFADKAYIQWDAANDHLELWNQQDGSSLCIKDTMKFSSDTGNTFHTVWHAGNDGSGSGLDADTLDGVHGASYLRSDTSDAFTSGALTINGMEFHQGNVERNLKLRGTGSSGNDVGLSIYNRNNTWTCQLYGTNGHYGFLDSNWGGWDIRKAPNGNFEVDEGSGLRRVVNAGNVGSGGSLSSSTVYADGCHLTNTSSPLHLSGWAYFESTTSGLYWNGGSSNAWYINPNANWYMTFRSGNSGSSAIDFRTSDNTQRGYVYADNSNNLGFLDPSGSWAFNTNRGTSSCYLYDQHFYTDTNGSYDIGSSSVRWRNGFFGGTVYDSKGNLRTIPQNWRTSAYTLVASDSGKHIATTSGTVTIPANVFSSSGGDAITIVNSSGSDITIAQGSGLTLYNSADASTGNRTLAGRGMATILFANATIAYISGAGLS